VRCLRVDTTAAKRIDTGEKWGILKKKRDPQARGEFVWLRRPEI
jgi:hypothetical protein